MQDDWFGKRDPFTWEPYEWESIDEWTDWDYAIMTAYQTIEQFTDSHGLLIYEVDDPKERVIVSAVKKIDRFEAAKAARTAGSNYKPNPGEYFVPQVDLRQGAEWPSHEEYIAHKVAQAEKEASGQ